jgi:hypothetical protein
VIVHTLPAASTVPVVQVVLPSIANIAAPLPETAKPLIVSAEALALFVTVTVWVVVVDENDNDVGDNKIVPEPSPVPLTATVCGEFSASS